MGGSRAAGGAWAALAYLIAGVCFILALRGLSHPTTSRSGNRYGMVGMLIAVVTTLVTHMPMKAGDAANSYVGPDFGAFGLIPWFAREPRVTYSTQNARSEELAAKPSYRQPWARGQRCIVPAWTFDEPNWESGRNTWWRFARADGAPWGLAGLWATWVDRASGELHESFTLLTVNADACPLMSRMHKPDPRLPPGAQDKRAVVPIEAADVDLDITKFTQFAATSTVASINPDGAPVGNVVGVEVSEDGRVSAIFDNNLIRLVAQIGLATFANPDGLEAVGGNAYVQSTDSGEYSVKQPQLGGAGKIQSSALEASTVDLSAEFTGLITTQRAYSASSKIITTADQMLEELINIKR